MNTINLGDFQVDFQYDFIKLRFNDGIHFSTPEFEKYYSLKNEIYGARKIGLLILNDHLEDIKYSFDPSVLITHNDAFLAHIKWIIVVSDKQMDYKNFEHLKKFTTIPCKFVTNFKALKRERL